MKTQKLKLSDIRINPNNPRFIRDDKFTSLVKSIKDFPEMLDLRPIVVNKDMVILGGNMRFKACKEAGIKEVPVIVAESITEEQEKEFLIKDNVSGGEWDWDVLANEWEGEKLEEWGLDVPDFGTDVNLDSFFEEDISDKSEKKESNTITLEYSISDYKAVIEAFEKHSGSKEQIVFKLLGL
jgi:ParB-like chromosome segregation protein Spo0J